MAWENYRILILPRTCILFVKFYEIFGWYFLRSFKAWLNEKIEKYWNQLNYVTQKGFIWESSLVNMRVQPPREARDLAPLFIHTTYVYKMRVK